MEARDRPVRVLLANKPRALRTRLARLLRLQSDIEVVGTVPASGEMPGICSHLFYEYPQLLILALSATQSRAYVYRQVITVEPLASTSDEDILTAVRQAKADSLSAATPKFEVKRHGASGHSNDFMDVPFSGYFASNFAGAASPSHTA